MKISNKKELELAIMELERKKSMQLAMMKEHYAHTSNSLKPKNLIKNAFSSVTHSSDAMNGVLKTAAGIGIGILTKRLFLGGSASLIQKIIGNVVEAGVAKTAINNTDKIKAYGSAIYNNLFKRKSKNKVSD